MIRNRKTKEATKLLGVNIAANETDLELGTFTRLENWVPADLFALKKKRGCAALNTTAEVTLTPSACA